ncbi:MAG: DNA methyltransferase [Candidatus Gastranaerophilales bacterium]|nr:DNA methyltransferase [Candidatus Gastranaerophilales bacterium]
MIIEEELNNPINKYLNTIIKGDCIKVLSLIPDNSVDLIFADPPYNLQIQDNLFRPNNTKVNGVQDNWDKFSSFEEYDKFAIAWLKECRRVLKNTGTIWIIGSYHNIFRVGKIMMDLGFWILNDIQWYKTNPMPNFKGTRFTNATETLIWCKKSETQKKYTFNYKLMKHINGNKQMGSVWHIPLCIGNERLRDEDGNKLHSTQKPEELLKRVILSSSNIGDIVLDPFFGSGTTGAVAKKLKRNFIGIEKEQNYIHIAKSRINKINTFLPELTIQVEEKLTQPKIPFKALIDENYVNEGDTIYFKKNKELKATILKDGFIKYENKTGSIHKIGSIIQKSESCNGWMNWYIIINNKFILIDDLRQKYKQEKEEGK